MTAPKFKIQPLIDAAAARLPDMGSQKVNTACTLLCVGAINAAAAVVSVKSPGSIPGETLGALFVGSIGIVSVVQAGAAKIAKAQEKQADDKGDAS